MAMQALSENLQRGHAELLQAQRSTATAINTLAVSVAKSLEGEGTSERPPDEHEAAEAECRTIKGFAEACDVLLTADLGDEQRRALEGQKAAAAAAAKLVALGHKLFGGGEGGGT